MMSACGKTKIGWLEDWEDGRRRRRWWWWVEEEVPVGRREQDG